MTRVVRKIYRLKAGNIANLKVVEEELDAPNANEVQIEIHTIGLNFADLYAVWGLYSATPKGEFVPGLEYAGVILKVGANVRKWKVGQRVMGITRFGGYASHLNIDERYVVQLADDWSFEDGAAFLVQSMTAYYALFELGNLEKGQTVMIHSGAGGVGLYANRLAKRAGAFTIGTTGSEAKVALMKAEGYDRAIVRGKGFSADVLEALGDRPLNLLLECIGGKVLRKGFDLLAPEGRMVVYGSAHFTSKGDRPNYFKLFRNYLMRPKIDPLQLPNTNRAILGFNLIWLYENVEKMHRMIRNMEEFDLPKPRIGHQFSFEQLPNALRTLRDGKTTGKVVVNVEV